MTLIIIPIYLQPIIKGWTEELFIEDFTSTKKVKEKAKKTIVSSQTINKKQEDASGTHESLLNKDQVILEVKESNKKYIGNSIKIKK